MRRTYLRRIGFVAALLLGALSQSEWAHANGFETPGNGPEQLGRGGAWLARASDPLATFYNPAALSRNGNGVSLSANLIVQKVCFVRTAPGDAVIEVGQNAQLYGPVCGQTTPFVNPQAAFQVRLTDKLGLGVAVLGPAAPGVSHYPDTAINTSAARATLGSPVQGPAATRYMLTDLNIVVLWPQVGVGYEVTPNLRIGASLIWGIASFSFSNYAMGLNSEQYRNPQGALVESAAKDIGAIAKANDLFVPGFTLSTLYTIDDIVKNDVSKNSLSFEGPPQRPLALDLSAWFHWSDAIRASGQTDLSSFVFDQKLNRVSTPNRQQTPSGHMDITVPQPLELRLGARLYQSRPQLKATSDTAQSQSVIGNPKDIAHKDPLHDELFDIELDGEWDHDSQFDTLLVRFNQPTTFIVPNGARTPLGAVPQNADVPHHWQDSFGVRLGGDWNLIPDRFAIRAGTWFQSSALRSNFVNLDFLPAQRLGLALGATMRVGPVDIQGGYEHVFFWPVDNHGSGNVNALTGDALVKMPNRSDSAINGGRLTASSNLLSLGGVVRWE